ncbi:MAG: GTPase ObgE [bacterium]|nr:GTPase ObgE [bacterium]
MFVDEVKLEVAAGRGGNGCMAFRREKYLPMGGPYGGNGGKGGDIRFIADEGLSTLLDLKYQRHIIGNNGQHGLGKNKNGKSGEDVVIKVPIGTTIYNLEDDAVIADLTLNNEEVVVATGGRGGRGNVSLATRSNPCPSFCENGELGQTLKLKLELRVMADVGLVGLPSVGKSTILSCVTKAKPKVAAYHFTTLSPNLGVVTTKDKKTFVMADLPGLIKGASSGSGLGYQFLKHVERTKVIVHIIDMSDDNAYDNYLTIRNELEKFSDKLLLKEEVIVANKMDLESSTKNIEKFKKKIGNKKVFLVSALKNEGFDNLITYLGEIVSKIKTDNVVVDTKIKQHVVYKFKNDPPFEIIKENNIWVVKGQRVEKLLRMSNFNTDESVRVFANKLRKMGVDKKLIELGANYGDTVRIINFEFIFEP